MTELLTAEVLFTARLKRRKNFVIRAIICILACYSVAFFFPLPDDIAYTWWYSSCMFLVFFLVTFCAVKAVYSASWSTILFCTTTAYTVRHLAYGVYTLIFSFFDGVELGGMYGSQILDVTQFNEWTLINVLSYLNIFVFAYLSAFFILSRYLKRAEMLQFKSTGLFAFVIVVLVVDIIINALVVYVTQDNIRLALLYFYNILCCLLIFYMQVSLIDTGDMKNEIETMSEALKQAEKQYSIQKENINLINMRCHDLKHQIGQFKREGVDAQTIKEIQEMISIYDSKVKTGNEVLDIILTEKSLLCHDKGIELECMADCSGLNFIREGDLYILFGNIIDNAIEAVSKIEDQSKRCIGFNVHTAGKFVTITADNYYEGEICLSADGLPETTKRDKEYHGFGMRSICAITEKYGGTLDIKAQDGVFNLNLMFQLPSKE
jgi:hypothetical protein